MNSPPPTPCHISMLIIKNNEYHVNLVLFDHEQPWNLWLFSPLNECSSTNNFLCQLFTNKHVSLALLLTSEQLPPRPFFSQGTCGMFKLGSNMSPPKPQVQKIWKKVEKWGIFLIKYVWWVWIGWKPNFFNLVNFFNGK
jgi:hypothetical protein